MIENLIDRLIVLLGVSVIALSVVTILYITQDIYLKIADKITYFIHL